MIEENDWRLQGQESFLKGAQLSFGNYEPAPGNDHDHCAFCSAKFMASDDPALLHEGFSTIDHYHWVCNQCFTDFKGIFQW
jgi:hypothetical protein